MTRKSRRINRAAQRHKGAGGVRLPPWLFYLIVTLAAIAAVALVGWVVFNPPPL